ncbi:MAG: methyltransferase domain-containing protein, partial [Proteobacteria bacterium]|nr:methyltransferase domain-containing protein [Pseudomonadota bacterium]
MKHWLIDLLRCPDCGNEKAPAFLLEIETQDEDDDVTKGRLVCRQCGVGVPIQRGIPRFVAADEDYAGNFGEQWNRFRTTQIDRLSGHRLSETRFLNDTKWSTDWLRGKLIVDAGCGAGRFTDVMAELGARVVACDLSNAVDACRDTVRDKAGHRDDRGDVEILQANLLNLPLRGELFDGLFCMGVIQHTPDPGAVMRALPRHLKPGGRLAYNFYEIDPLSKYQAIKYWL